jgi:hypothetical protein
MEEIDALLDALWNAAIEGDFEAAMFLQMFAPWAVSQVSCYSRNKTESALCTK